MEGIVKGNQKGQLVVKEKGKSISEMVEDEITERKKDLVENTERFMFYEDKYDGFKDKLESLKLTLEDVSEMSVGEVFSNKKLNEQLPLKSVSYPYVFKILKHHQKVVNNINRVVKDLTDVRHRYDKIDPTKTLKTVEDTILRTINRNAKMGKVRMGDKNNLMMGGIFYEFEFKFEDGDFKVDKLSSTPVKPKYLTSVIGSKEEMFKLISTTEQFMKFVDDLFKTYKEFFVDKETTTKDLSYIVNKKRNKTGAKKLLRNLTLTEKSAIDIAFLTLRISITMINTTLSYVDECIKTTQTPKEDKA